MRPSGATGLADVGPAALPAAGDESETTFGGWVLFALTLSLFLSAIPEARPEIGGLSIHPYLLLLGPAVLVLLVRRSSTVRRRSLGGWGIFVLIGVGLSFLASGELEYALFFLAKWTTVGLTFLVASRLPLTQGDLRLGIFGLIGSVSFIAIRGLMIYQADTGASPEMMPQIGSRNVFSLWTLAPLAFCLWLIASAKTKWTWKLVLLGAVIIIGICQVLSLSRSGWIVLAATAALVFSIRRSLGVVLGVVVMSVVISEVVTIVAAEERISNRMDELIEGTHSDEERGQIILRGFEIFFENPIFGVSPRKLPTMLGRRLGTAPINSHNLMIDQLAGVGLVGTLPLLMCCLIIFRRARAALSEGNGPAVELSGLVFVLLGLIVLRGTTTDEILYNPSVIIGLAIAFAAACIALEHDPDEKRGQL